MQEKSRYELLQDERNKLERDLKNLLEKRFSQPSLLKRNTSDTDIKAAKQEKIILESLAIRVDDLEVENIFT